MRRIKVLANQKNIVWLLIVLGIIGITISIFLYANEPEQLKIAAHLRPVDVNSAPSSVKPSKQTVATYTVPPNHPRYIAIPAIGIANTPVIKLGVLSSGAIATPNNMYETGWYDNSSLPGQKGAMFVYGHVSSWAANGVFYNLKKLVAGDSVIVSTGDGRTYTYKVVSSKVYPYNNVDMGQVLSPISSSSPGLNLMTCTGRIIKGTSEFNQRLVVFTKLAS